MTTNLITVVFRLDQEQLVQMQNHPSAYVNDEYMGYSKSDLDTYAMQVLNAHGIGGME